MLKRWLGPHLPRWLIERIKGHLETQLNHGPVRDMTLESSGAAVRCTFDHQWSFLAPQDCQPDLAYQSSTQEGRAEFSGIADIALQGGTLFDIGAHIGLISALFCVARPTNKVY